MSLLHTENPLVRKAITILVVAGTFAALAGFIMLRAQAETTEDTLTAIYVEPGLTDTGRLESNVDAEIATAVAAGDRILLAAALDGTDATTFTSDLGCEAGANKLRCKKAVEETHLAVLGAVEGLLDAPSPASVDTFASVRGLTQHLRRHPAAGGVTLFMNITGRHDVAPVDLAGPGLSDRIDDVVNTALSSGQFPDDTTGVTAYIIMPFSGDTVHDAAIEEVFSRLFGMTGGHLEYFGQIWTADDYEVELPEFEEQGVTATSTGVRTTISLDAALFDSGSDELRPESLAAIDEVVVRIANLDEVLSIAVIGLADQSGGPDFNLDLTARRADTVRRELLLRLDRAGVDLAEHKVTSHGAGSAEEAGENDQRYRRVDIVVTARSGT